VASISNWIVPAIFVLPGSTWSKLLLECQKPGPWSRWDRDRDQTHTCCCVWQTATINPLHIWPQA